MSKSTPSVLAAAALLLCPTELSRLNPAGSSSAIGATVFEAPIDRECSRRTKHKRFVCTAQMGVFAFWRKLNKENVTLKNQAPNPQPEVQPSNPQTGKPRKNSLSQPNIHASSTDSLQKDRSANSLSLSRAQGSQPHVTKSVNPLTANVSPGDTPLFWGKREEISKYHTPYYQRVRLTRAKSKLMKQRELVDKLEATKLFGKLNSASRVRGIGVRGIACDADLLNVWFRFMDGLQHWWLLYDRRETGMKKYIKDKKNIKKQAQECKEGNEVNESEDVDNIGYFESVYMFATEHWQKYKALKDVPTSELCVWGAAVKECVDRLVVEQEKEEQPKIRSRSEILPHVRFPAGSSEEGPSPLALRRFSTYDYLMELALGDIFFHNVDFLYAGGKPRAVHGALPWAVWDKENLEHFEARSRDFKYPPFLGPFFLDYVSRCENNGETASKISRLLHSAAAIEQKETEERHKALDKRVKETSADERLEGSKMTVDSQLPPVQLAGLLSFLRFRDGPLGVLHHARALEFMEQRKYYDFKTSEDQEGLKFALHQVLGAFATNDGVNLIGDANRCYYYEETLRRIIDKLDDVDREKSPSARPRMKRLGFYLAVFQLFDAWDDILAAQHYYKHHPFPYPAASS